MQIFFLFFIQARCFFSFNLGKVKRAYNKYPTIKLQHKWTEKSPYVKKRKSPACEKDPEKGVFVGQVKKGVEPKNFLGESLYKN